MRGGNLHETIPALRVGSLLPGLQQRIIRARKRNPVDHHKGTRTPRYIHALPQRQRAKQTGILILGKLFHQHPSRIITLAENIKRQPRPHRLRGLHRRASGGKQPQRASTGGSDQAGQFVQELLRQTIPPRLGKVAGGIQNPRLRRVKRGARIQAVPTALRQAPAGGHGVEIAADGKGRAGQHHRVVQKQLAVQQPSHRQWRHLEGVPATVITGQPHDIPLFGGIILREYL